MIKKSFFVKYPMYIDGCPKKLNERNKDNIKDDIDYIAGLVCNDKTGNLLTSVNCQFSNIDFIKYDDEVKAIKNDFEIPFFTLRDDTIKTVHAIAIKRYKAWDIRTTALNFISTASPKYRAVFGNREWLAIVKEKDPHTDKTFDDLNDVCIKRVRDKLALYETTPLAYHMDSRTMTAEGFRNTIYSGHLPVMFKSTSSVKYEAIYYINLKEINELIEDELYPEITLQDLDLLDSTSLEDYFIV